MSVRVGVIGAGSWTLASHLPRLQQRGDVDLVAVSRLEQQPLDMIKQRFGFEVASTNYLDVVEADIDVCVVGSPAGLHYEHTAAALNAGAHVLCEKPFTINPQDAWELDELARAKERELTVAFGWNFFPMAARAKELFEHPGIGRLESVAVRMISTAREILTGRGGYPDAAPDAQPMPETWTDPRLSGGGYGHAQLSHALGLLFWITDERIKESTAIMLPDTSVDLQDAIAVRFDSGAIGTFSGASYPYGSGAQGYRFELEIIATGDEGQLHLDLARPFLRLFRPDGDLTETLETDAGEYHCRGPLDFIIDHARGKQGVNAASASLAARTVEALDLAYRSADSGRPVHRTDHETR